jgi:hypothetical protein
MGSWISYARNRPTEAKSFGRMVSTCFCPCAARSARPRHGEQAVVATLPRCGLFSDYRSLGTQGCGRGAGVGRGRATGVALGVMLGVTVGVAVCVAVAVGVGVELTVAVGVGVGVAVVRSVP